MGLSGGTQFYVFLNNYVSGDRERKQNSVITISQPITHSRGGEEQKTETRILNGRHGKYKIDILREYGKEKQ